MLVAFHSDCDVIYKIVEDIGVIIREVRDLEDQVNDCIFQIHSINFLFQYLD